MMEWCAYCQRYLGEKPPLMDFSLTHGICDSCLASNAQTAPQVGRARAVQDLFLEVTDKALHGRSLSFYEVIERSRNLSITDADLLMGIIQPVLYAVGKEYEYGRLRIATEHTFTMFCEDLLRALSGERIHDVLFQETTGCKHLLVCVDCNYHSLGIQFTRFLLNHDNDATVAISPGLPADEIIALVRLYKPSILGISVSMASQIDSLRELAALLSGLPDDVRPAKVILGGFVFRTCPVQVDPLFTIAPFCIRDLKALF